MAGVCNSVASQYAELARAVVISIGVTGLPPRIGLK